MQRVVDAVPDLDRQPLLHLKPPRESLHDPCHLAQPRDLPIRNIRHVALSQERHHVVLAGGVKLYVFHQHHLAVLLIEYGGLDDLPRPVNIPA